MMWIFLPFKFETLTIISFICITTYFIYCSSKFVSFFFFLNLLHPYVTHLSKTKSERISNNISMYFVNSTQHIGVFPWFVPHQRPRVNKFEIKNWNIFLFNIKKLDKWHIKKLRKQFIIMLRVLREYTISWIITFG